MGHPVRCPDEWRSVPRYRIGQSHSVSGAAERDVLARQRRLRRKLGRRFGRAAGEERADELVAAAAHSPDIALRFAVVAECPTGGFDAACQRCLADETSAPYGVEELLLGDEPVGITNQLGEDVEHLGLDADHVTCGAQLVALGVEDKAVEAPHAGFWK